MPEYRYSELSRNSIRLLQLLPSRKNSTPLQGDIFEYPLQDSGTLSCPYEALSYVWGSEEKPDCITINEHDLNITRNLYTALLHLRDHTCPRLIWIDAICINQDDKDKEKEEQIPLMPEIYARAQRVVVWLGDAGEDGDEALEAIRRYTSEISLDIKLFAYSIQKLLQRPWFQRIWVRFAYYSKCYLD